MMQYQPRKIPSAILNFGIIFAAVFKRIFTDTFQLAELESLEYQQQHPGRASRKVLVIGFQAAFSLSCIYYFASPQFTAGFFKALGLDGLASSLLDAVGDGPHARLFRLMHWVVVLNLFYFIIPAIVIKTVFRERLSEYGLRIKGAFKDYGLYIIMLLVMLPLVWYFSGTKSFQARYPFYSLLPGEGLTTDFWWWELLYFSQFFTLEFFFRGYMTLGLRHRFGYYSVFVMMIPYCMIHFGKPMPETIGAILAGIVLGTVSLKSRSVLLGVLIHYSVAITMDMFALWRKGFFGE